MAPRLPIFADALRRAREGDGYTQQEIADLAEVTVQQIKRYEAGTSEPSLDVLRRLGVVFGGGVDPLVYHDVPDDEDRHLAGAIRRLQRLPAEEQTFIRRVLTALVENAEHAQRKRAR